MQEKIKMLKSLITGLDESYDEYLESEYDNNAPVHWNNEDKVYEGPDFDQWTRVNCLKFMDWVREQADFDQIEEILSVCLDITNRA